ncbi:MAG: phosphotransferase family protein [Desulfobacterales bacterium]
MTQEQIVQQFKNFLAHRVPDAIGIDIRNVRPIFGGASRETFALELEIKQKTAAISRNVVVRREFDLGIIETETRTEWEAYRAFAGTEVPVPELLWLEEDPQWMGSPFFVMEEVVDCTSSAMLFEQPPYNEVRRKIGERFCEIMGIIARTDPKEVWLHEKMEKPAADECWKRELDYWESDIDKKELEPHPLVRAAIRWLRKNPPPPAQKVVIAHGDMRAGNFLFNEKGEIRAILDWEMMHMGDPLEDLAWSMNRLWSWKNPDYLGNMLPRDRAVKVWEQASGFKADPAALFWWEVFTSIKGLAIWISQHYVYSNGASTDAINCYGGLWAFDIQSRILLNQMREGV